MLQFFGAGLFETENLAALGVDPRQDVPDGTILSGGIHPLENKQQRIFIGRVVKALQGTQRLDVFLQEFLVPFLRLANGLYGCRPLPEVDLFTFLNTEILRVDFHLHPFGRAIRGSRVVKARLLVRVVEDRI